jgi:hypothetical protein
MSAQIYSSGYSANGLRTAAYHRLLGKLSVQLPVWMQELGCDGIVVCGTSGLSIGYGLSAKLKNPPPTIIVRKSESHDSRVSAIGGVQTVSRLLMVDDMVDTGSTVQFVYRHLSSYNVELVAVGCYNRLAREGDLPDPRLVGCPAARLACSRSSLREQHARSLEVLMQGRKVFAHEYSGDDTPMIPIFNF